jgi:hypothetical protein
VEIIQNTFKEEFICGNTEEHKHEALPPSSPNNFQRAAGCGSEEYSLTVGAGADFEFVVRRAGGSSTLARAIIIGRFGRVITDYGDCEMRVIATLISVVIEPCNNCFYSTPTCLFNSGNSDAFAYNVNFASSPFRPAGDVATLWTGQELRGALCIGDIGGMAFLIGGVCGFRGTNVIQGNLAGGIWTHEIGHNLGVGINHGNISPPFFYGNGTLPWHPNTISTIHSRLDDAACVEKEDFCCASFNDVFICRDDATQPFDWCARPKVNRTCYGDMDVINGSASPVGNQICGTLAPNQTGTWVSVRQSTSGLGCEFNRTSFRVIDCTNRTPRFPFAPPGFTNICSNDFTKKCFKADCISSWQYNVPPGNPIFVSTNGNEICVTNNGLLFEGEVSIQVRPRYYCGSYGQWETWRITIVRCDGPGDGNPRSASTNTNSDTEKEEVSPIQVEGVLVFPNPARDLVNVISDQEINTITLFDLNGKLLKSAEINSNQYQLDVSNLVPSVYVIHLASKDGKTIETKRLVVKD